MLDGKDPPDRKFVVVRRILGCDTHGVEDLPDGHTLQVYGDLWPCARRAYDDIHMRLAAA